MTSKVDNSELESLKVFPEPKTNRFVAFFDIIGFKNLIREDHFRRGNGTNGNQSEVNFRKHEMFTVLMKVAQLSTFLEQESESSVETDKNCGKIEIVTFSDTFFLFSESDSITDFANLSKAVSLLMNSLISEHNLMLKGVIAHGEAVCDKASQIYFGNPIIDAYELEADLAYLGAVLHQSAELQLIKLIKELPMRKDRDRYHRQFIIEKPTPFKSGYVIHKNINWPAISKCNLLDGITKLRFGSSGGSQRKYIDNTLDFFEAPLINENENEI